MDFKKSIYNLIVLLFDVEVSTETIIFNVDNLFRHCRNMSINLAQLTRLRHTLMSTSQRYQSPLKCLSIFLSPSPLPPPHTRTHTMSGVIAIFHSVSSHIRGDQYFPSQKWATRSAILRIEYVHMNLMIFKANNQ
jgi:hypothetical protein